MNKLKIPKEVCNFIANAEYHYDAALALNDRQHIADRIYLLLVALENADCAEKIHREWIHDKQSIPSNYFRTHRMKFTGVRNPVIRVKFNGKIRSISQIEYSTPKQLEKLMNICRYGTGRGTESIRDYFSTNSRWFDDELIKEVRNRIEWTKLGIELSEKFLKGDLK